MISLSDLANGAKRLKEFADSVQQLDLKEALLEQRELLQDAREAIVDLRAENAALKEELAARDDLSARTASLVDCKGFLYQAGENGQPVGQPFCGACIERRDGLFLTAKVVQKGGSFHYVCPNCDADYGRPQTFLHR
ncbi:hypothetical protein HKCCSP123_06205 [Rhodobacterales bacterium HKCCSP123]|nr:hypothetical protein [Rhodobacterales bacterium HKCCSP123]